MLRGGETESLPATGQMSDTGFVDVTIGEGKRAHLRTDVRALSPGDDGPWWRRDQLPLTREFQFDVESLLRIEQTKPDVVILCSPNNPTGCVLSLEDLRRLLSIAPGLVVIDEAYHEFAQRSAVPLLKEFDRLVVLRTFSKAMALAALRVGYLLASPELVKETRKAVLPYNLNAFSQTAAEVAVDLYEAELLPLVRVIISERDRLFEELKKIQGLTPISQKQTS